MDSKSSDLKGITTATSDAFKVNEVTVKLPFYTMDPVTWYQRAEAQLGLRGILLHKTKFWHILSALDADTSACASQVVASVKVGLKHSTLKAFLIKCYMRLPSRWECAECILAVSELEDRHPIQVHAINL